MIKTPRTIFAFLILSLLAGAAAMAQQLRIEPVPFESEVLPNGLRVIYSPLHTAPVVHVRVLYHVGSRDERPDRQGFAHMFEHMMFRGSAHVPPEQHMKLINVVGGNSNAFTSFDQTTYVNTIPSNAVEMALYLEADRMASFKVNDTIFQTERKVVAEEWRLRTANPPLGTMSQDFYRTAYAAHSYRWTPIGDMDQLRSAKSSELQEFFNKYYIPNNACLIIAGDIDVAKTKEWVKKYFAWIPRGANIDREIPAEPEQTAAKDLVVYKPNVPLTNIYMGFKTTGYASDDHYALSLLGDILSSGRTGILDRQFVNGDNPSCVSVGAGDSQLEDQSLFVIESVIQQGKDPAQVEKDILAAVYQVAEKGVTADELEKVRTQARQSLIRGRQTCTAIATELGEEAVFGGDPARVNEVLAKMDAVTPATIQQVAKKYLTANRLTVVQYRPDPTGINARRANAAALADAVKNAPVVPSTAPIEPRAVQFPAGYPTEPPFNPDVIHVTFNKGTEDKLGDLKIITLTDHRLPLVNVSLIMPGGSDSEPVGKVGIGGLAMQMMRRGTGGIPFLDFSNDLESRGISIDPTDASDTTRLNISCTTDQLDYAIARANLVLGKPDFPASEYDKLKEQWIAGLIQQLSDPTSVADREIGHAVYEGSTQGRIVTQQSLSAVTLEDVKDYYRQFFQLEGAMILFSGDIDPARAKELTQKLLADFDRKKKPAAADYALKNVTPRMILVDNPEGKQATIRMASRAFDIHDDSKYAGSLAGTILSAGIESRLNKYVRAEKGLTYGCRATFNPGRHTGDFSGSVNTNPETAAAAIEAMFKVYNDMRAENVTPTELAEAKARTVGGMVMEMQTIAQQAGRRLDQILNDYPIDYFDRYPEHLNAVTADQIKDVMNKYVAQDKMMFVVVGPASVIKPQLEKLGPVQVLPMPLDREK